MGRIFGILTPPWVSASATVGIVTSAPAAKGTPRGTVYSDALGSRDVEQIKTRVDQGAKSRRPHQTWSWSASQQGEKFKVTYLGTLQLHFAFSLRKIRKSHCCCREV
jgi:hypothetical protein